MCACADILWCGREGSPSTDLNSHRAISQTEMLRMDAAALLVQLNIRALLQVRSTALHSSISAACIN